MEAVSTELAVLRSRLDQMETSSWPIEQQVDWHLVRAEMNGMDFNIRILKPWARDPAYYTTVWDAQSDTPAHEGPAHHGLLEVWQYDFPLSADAAVKMEGTLRSIPSLLTQARTNLVGNAREMWESGIGNLRGQAASLESLRGQTGEQNANFQEALTSAHTETLQFVEWLEEQTPSKTEPSGIGRENYTWYLRNVHLVPLSWEEEVALLKRELDRAHTSLRLEEHRNRNLPAITPIGSSEEYATKANGAVDKYLDFLDSNDILEVRDYMEPALRAQIGSYVPLEERNFFRRAIHHEPLTLWTHFYHWWDLEEMKANPHPSPIRRRPLLFNIWDSRAEGLSTGIEEMMMHAGLYDDNPRAREVVWIMLAQRAARGLGSLYVHGGEMTMKEARDFHVAWTPRGWMREDLDLLGFEQQLYLRQPGYGSSYITGKYLVERLLADRSRQQPDSFDLSNFFDEINGTGLIPVSLTRWQLTGLDDEVQDLMAQ